MRILLYTLTYFSIIALASCNFSSQKETEVQKPTVLVLDSTSIESARTLLASGHPVPLAIYEKYYSNYSTMTSILFSSQDSGRVTIRMALCDSCERIELYSKPLNKGIYWLDLKNIIPKHQDVIRAIFYIEFQNMTKQDRWLLL